MRVYLAASYSRKEEIRKIAEELKEMGINIQARWLYEPKIPMPQDRDNFLRERAEIDADDVLLADVLVRFSDDLSEPMVPAHLATGSRMFEMGLAWADGTKIVVVGGHQCVFDYLKQIVHLPDVEALKQYLFSLQNSIRQLGASL